MSIMFGNMFVRFGPSDLSGIEYGDWYVDDRYPTDIVWQVGHDHDGNGTYAYRYRVVIRDAEIFRDATEGAGSVRPLSDDDCRYLWRVVGHAWTVEGDQ